MELKYNVTGQRRKELAEAVSTITGEELIYLGVPTFNYQAGCFTIDRFGTVSFCDRTNTEIAGDLIEKLYKTGFVCETPEQIDGTSENNKVSADGINTVISLPAEKVNVENLEKILQAKGALIKKALGISALPIEIQGGRIVFPWFDELNAEGTEIYTRFIEALCAMSLKLKRVTSKEKETVNDKYAFRCFLLRLGFIGNEYKTLRKELLKNLAGNSAFKTVRATA